MSAEKATGKRGGKYPECEKLAREDKRRTPVLHFLEWCQEQGIELAKMDGRGHLDPVMERDEEIVLRWLEIDPKKLEGERRAMLEALGG